MSKSLAAAKLLERVFVLEDLPFGCILKDANVDGIVVFNHRDTSDTVFTRTSLFSEAYSHAIRVLHISRHPAR